MISRPLRVCLLAALVLFACGPSDRAERSAAPAPASAPSPVPGAFGAHVAHRDTRLGVPSFVWVDRSGLPRFANAREAARATLEGLSGTFTLTRAALDAVTTAEIHDAGRGPIIARFAQRVGDVEVFRGGLNVAMTRTFEPIAASGFLAPTLEGSARPFALPAASAVDAAWQKVVAKGVAGRTSFASLVAQGGYERFTAPGLWAPARVKRVLFPLASPSSAPAPAPLALEPAYYVELMLKRGGAWSFVVSASDGRVLFENDLVRNDAYTYRVFADANTKIPMDGPHGNGFQPHPTGRPDGTKLTWVPSQLVTLQNYPFSQNDPWLPPGATLTTQGNAVHAYDDLAAPDGLSVDTGDVIASVTSPGIFDLAYDPTLPPNASSTQLQASASQMFYVTNFLHDWYYDDGFDERSGNHQHDNYGRGGLGFDPLKAEAQDSSGRNNSDAMTPADGSPPRIQMYVFSGTSAASLVVSAPASIAGTKEVGLAAFGKDAFTLTGDVVLADDGQGVDTHDGCEPITNAVTGRIALVHRGLCSFVQKVQNAQSVGAIGVLVANVPTSAQPDIPPQLGGTDTTNVITIPSLGLALADGTALEAALGQVVTVTMKRALQTDLDGAHDTSIVAHEWGHVLSNRLIANGSGLTTNQSGGLGEGWADFSALLLTVRADDLLSPANVGWSGAYVSGGYAMSGQADIYYGTRRVPYSIDFGKDPLTFKHIQNGVPLPTNGAPIQFGEDGSFNSEVHSTGEVWATMLWECYATLLQTHGFVEAQARMKRYFVAAFKMTPPDPTLLEARDAMLAAVYAADPPDYLMFWQAFARRGAGVGAEGPPKDSTSNIGVTESTFVGNDVAFADVVVADDLISCDHDGMLDPGEVGTIKLTVKNAGTGPLFAPVVSVASKTPGVSVVGAAAVALATLKPFESAKVTLNFGLAGQTPNQAVVLDLLVADGALPAGAAHHDLSVRFASDEAPESSATDSVDTKGTSWKASSNDGSGLPGFVRQRQGRNQWWTVADPVVIADQVLTSPKFTLDGTTFSLSFKHRWSFRISTRRKVDVDGGVVEISVDGGQTWDDIGKYGKVDYNTTIDTAGRGDNPLKGRAAYGNTSAGYPDAWISSKIDLALPAHPDAVQIRFHAGSGTGFAGAPGWDVDDIALTGISSTPFWSFVAHQDACDANAPTVEAGQGRTVMARTPVALSGSGESPGGFDLVFAWTQENGPLVQTNGADTTDLSFVAPDTRDPVTLTFALRANDGKLLSPAARVDVKVNPYTADLAASGNGCTAGARPSRSVGGLWLALGALGLATARRRRSSRAA